MCECFQKQKVKTQEQEPPEERPALLPRHWVIVLYSDYTLISLERLFEHQITYNTELDITVYHIRQVFKIVSTIFLTHSFHSKEKNMDPLTLQFPKYRVICSTKQCPPPV